MDKKCFESFFKEKYSQAYFLALRILHDDEASKDVVADAFELVLRRTKQEKVDNISAYLMTSVRNVCLDYIRKQNVRSHYVQASVQSTEPSTQNPDNWDVREEKIQAIMLSLDELTPRTRQILKLCYVERKKYREVALELDISESAVKKHIMQALSYMRQKFRTRQFY
ncbi:sigma-70 family RNA polymerase sigma factor [uncultured Prevotella sp.]|uniref:RNA polymerase sigma factor n=1 Tax=uncultured Prevotella sp. TaxID=159272 RepID=UPI00263A3730|nr:sigma-70 family RNA polymerase sigma factor [uncultured Prevotella sp.]